MDRTLDQKTVDDISRRLAELLALPMSRISAKREPSVLGSQSSPIDLLVSAGDFRFAVEYKANGSAADVGMAVRAVLGFAEKSRAKAIPLVAAPYVGEVGQRLCKEAGVCWIDLSGNAHLVAPGLRVIIEGKPNRFKRAGRPRSVFAPKSSRIARWLLMEPHRSFTQRDLANAADLDEGFTSRIVRHLEEQRLVTREAGGAVKVADPSALLTAWREAYDFSRHHIVRGHVSARSSDEILRRLVTKFRDKQLDHAVTGLAGAWLTNHFAGFRLVSVYVKQLPASEVLEEAGFHPEPQGENVWLVVPNDEGVFQGASDRDGLRCVHPVQVYMDLKDQPERAAEAAEALRKDLFSEAGHA